MSFHGMGSGDHVSYVIVTPSSDTKTMQATPIVCFIKTSLMICPYSLGIQKRRRSIVPRFSSGRWMILRLLRTWWIIWKHMFPIWQLKKFAHRIGLWFSGHRKWTIFWRLGCRSRASFEFQVMYVPKPGIASFLSSRDIDNGKSGWPNILLVS